MDGLLLLLDGYVLVSLPIDLFPPPPAETYICMGGGGGGGGGEYWTGAGFDYRPYLVDNLILRPSHMFQKVTQFSSFINL